MGDAGKYELGEIVAGDRCGDLPDVRDALRIRGSTYGGGGVLGVLGVRSPELFLEGARETPRGGGSLKPGSARFVGGSAPPPLKNDSKFGMPPAIALTCSIDE